MKRIAVSGSRGIKDQARVWEILDRHFDDRLVVMAHGACMEGVDHLADGYALFHGIPTDPFPVSKAEWRALGKKAGPMRNERMIKTADELVAIWDGRSRGTLSAINASRELRVPHHVYFLDAN